MLFHVVSAEGCRCVSEAVAKRILVVTDPQGSCRANFSFPADAALSGMVASSTF